MLNYLQLCLVTHQQDQPFHLYRQLITEAVLGGVTSVQLRVKNKNPHELLRLAQEYKALLDALDIPLIINDHVALARTIDAAGAHIGQSDISPQQARAILGPNKILGLSINNYTQLAVANTLTTINYIGITVFPSQTKSDCETIWGLGGLRAVARLSNHPIVGIGGIDQTNAWQVRKAGAAGIAVISAIHHHSSPQQAAAELISMNRD